MHEICANPWNFHVKSFQIVDRLYYVGNRDVSVHLIDTDNGLILIDTAFPQSDRRIDGSKNFSRKG